MISKSPFNPRLTIGKKHIYRMSLVGLNESGRVVATLLAEKSEEGCFQRDRIGRVGQFASEKGEIPDLLMRRSRVVRTLLNLGVAKYRI